MSGLSLACACSNQDNKLCECVEKGAKLDVFSKTLLEKQKVTTSDEKKLNDLRKSMHKSCDAFKFIPVKALQQKKLECKSLEFEAE